MQEKSSQKSLRASSDARARTPAASLAHRLRGKVNSKGYWMAHCPCHDDHDPSLQIWDTDEGPAFKCYAGCGDREIRVALGIDGDGGFGSDGFKGGGVKEEKRMEMPGRLDRPDMEAIERLFHVYTDESDKPVARVERIKYADGRKTFRQQRPTTSGGWLNGLGGFQPPLYKLPTVKAAIAKGERVFVVEGEKVCDVLGRLDITATTNPMGAGKWRQHHTEALRGARVVILPDNDEPGRKHGEQVAEALRGVATSVRIVNLPNLPPKGDAVDWLEAGGTKEDLLKLLADKNHIGIGEPPEVFDWELPVPFSEPDLPTFPTEALPSWLKEWVQEEAEATQTPVDLSALIGLSVIAAACQRKVRIRLWDGYEEPVNIYTAIVLPPGSRKSAVMADATRVIRKFEKEQADKMRDEVAQAESRLRRLEKKLRIAEEQVAKSDGSEAEADRLSTEVAKARAELPVLPRLVVDDVTPEKIVQLMGEQGGKIAVFSPEGGIFETMAGRYSGSIPNFDAFLKAHTGEDLITDRLTRKGNHVIAAALTMCLAIQPDVIRSMSSKNGFRGRGLTARFLYALPNNLMGRRRIRTPSVSDFTQHDYDFQMRKLLDLKTSDDGAPMVLLLSEEARKEFENFAGWLEPQLAPNGELGFMADWGGKLAGVIARMAALLHMAEYAEGPDNAWKESVSAATIKTAVAIGQFLLAHACATYAEMGADKHLDDARYLWGWIESTGELLLKKQRIWQGTRGRFKKSEVLDAALLILCDRGFLHETASERKPGTGRKPAPTYAVNPLAF